MNNPKEMRLTDELALLGNTLGKHVYAHDGTPEVYLFRGSKIHIGNFVQFGPRVKLIVGGEHYTEWVSTFPFGEMYDDVPKKDCIDTKGDIVIGSDVWVGAEAMILSGVTIGHGAVIGARSVVTKDVMPYCIYAGNPAHFIRSRFTPQQKKELLDIKWWEWDDEKIASVAHLLMSSDISAFIYRCKKEGLVHAV